MHHDWMSWALVHITAWAFTSTDVLIRNVREITDQRLWSHGIRPLVALRRLAIAKSASRSRSTRSGKSSEANDYLARHPCRPYHFHPSSS